MTVIPVLDLKNGIVVHAKKGNREQYKPLSSKLTSSVDPKIIFSIFTQRFQFKTIYIADLDAISGQGNHTAIIKTLLQSSPNSVIWLDSGYHFLESDKSLQKRCVPIIGTEMNFTIERYINIKNNFPTLILSLDFNENKLLGDKTILDQPELWPNNVIIMDLDKVGSEQGLNIQRIKRIQSKLQTGQQLFVAGGIKQQSDLEQLESLQVAGVLISTAIHKGKLNLNDD